jgi:hypothetical protein
MQKETSEVGHISQAAVSYVNHIKVLRGIHEAYLTFGARLPAPPEGTSEDFTDTDEAEMTEPTPLFRCVMTKETIHYLLHDLQTVYNALVSLEKKEEYEEEDPGR